MINLKEWLKTNDIYNLKGFEHAAKLKNTLEANEFSEKLRLSLESMDSRPLELIKLDQAEGG
jgi:hypothetical protein